MKMSQAICVILIIGAVVGAISYMDANDEHVLRSVFWFIWTSLIWPGTSIWVGVDSGKIGLRRYKNGLSYDPVVLGILCYSFWIVAFPWYLVVRRKIMNGTAELRPECEPWSTASVSGRMSPRGLIQPWRGRRL
jgi:hypothetical protein